MRRQKPDKSYIKNHPLWNKKLEKVFWTRLLSHFSRILPDSDYKMLAKIL
jgi:hypothetical protein